MGYVGVGDTGQPPQKVTNTPRTNRMEIQFFDNQTTEKTRSHRPPTPLTSLVKIKITTQLTITTTKHVRLLSSIGGGAVPPRWPSVAVYLRSNRQSQVPAAPQGRGDQVFVQQNVQTHGGYVVKLGSHPWRDQHTRIYRTTGISICEMNGIFSF